ncbi:MAG: ferredoxin [Frankiaceae bacterium]
MRLTIDPGGCTGHGRCYDLASDLIDEDARGGYGRVRLRGLTRVAGGRRGMKACPQQAITLQ